MQRKKVKSKQYNRGAKSTKPISTKKNKTKKKKRVAPECKTKKRIEQNLILGYNSAKGKNKYYDREV